jgi:hypothetical protein
MLPMMTYKEYRANGGKEVDNARDGCNIEPPDREEADNLDFYVAPPGGYVAPFVWVVEQRGSKPAHLYRLVDANGKILFDGFFKYPPGYGKEVLQLYEDLALLRV